jgi:PAS domain S-box-containing protein
LPIAVALIDNNFRFSSYSKEFVRLLNINDKIDLSLLDINKIFEKGFITQLENYLKNSDKNPEIKINYLFAEKAQLNTEVNFKKIFFDSGEYFGTQIIITQKLDSDYQIETKAKMYEALIEHLPEAMFIYDIENLKFLDVNDTALKLYGYKRNDFLNMDLTDLYAPEDIQTLIQTGDGKIVQGSYSGPWRHKKNDGTSILVELRRSSIEFRGKKAHLNLVRNVSEQAESKKRTQILESAFDNTSDPVIITDKDGFITEMNEPVSKRFGYSKKDLETRPFISLVIDDDRAKINKNIFHSGIMKPSILDIEIKKPSGTFHKANLIATPIKNFSGDIDSFSLVIKPIDELVITKDVKKTQEDSIEKIDPPFLSNVFHELLTPINVILGFTQELGESIQKPNEEQKEAVDIIKQNQKLLLQIMDNAVEYSTLEQKIVKLKSEHIKFVDLLNELKENTRKIAEDKKVELSYGKISSSLEIETDRQKIISLLSLFIKFAIQITKEEKIFLSASIYQDSYCAVGIKDTSKTITPYLLKAFTDIFSDDENMSRRNYGFSRFSVKLAKKLIDLLSIKKETITKDADQAEFALVIPIKLVINNTKKLEVEKIPQQKIVDSKQTQKVNGKQPEKISIPSSVQIEKKPLDLTQLSCLYLEDQVDSQMLFKSQMKDLKNIEFAPSFESALPLLKTKKFDFLVMDINLQGEYNGLDALRIIQKMPGYKNVPVIASTAYLLPGARDSFIAAGFNDFVSKPLLRDKLLEVLKTLF